MSKKIKNRPAWFSIIKVISKIFIRKPKIRFLGEKISQPSLVLCNHNGAISPLKLELYFNYPFRFWGTYEMTLGIRSVYKYLKNVYFSQKKHFFKFISTIFAFFASPFVNLFYKGLNLIPTYPDTRLITTIHESLKTIENNSSIIIFPEDSHDGYHDKLTMFYAGFVSLAKHCFNHGHDLPIFAAYYKNKTNELIIDRPIKTSKLLKSENSRQKIADMLCIRSNKLAEL